jgi:sarcosine oxidase/L-pipecolate oxidase
VLVLGIDNTSECNPVTQEGTSSSLVYADESFINDLELGCSLLPLPDPASVRSALPSDVRTGSFEGDGLVYYRRKGYLNRDGGWADAGQGVRILLSEVKKLGVKVLSEKPVSNIQWDDGKATGVSCADGTTYDADVVVLATGSWTPSAFRDLDLGGRCLSTGYDITWVNSSICRLTITPGSFRQIVAMIQLTEDEAERYQNCPVVLDFLNGFYCFPVR